MATKDIIVIGASAGGIEALSDLVRRLPSDFGASIFVVVHIPPVATSVLPRIIARRGKLPALHPKNGDKIEGGRLYVAPPNFHLVLNRRSIRLVRGRKEHGVRPAVDPLFRSAALAFGDRVVGILLSGNLDDGTAGLEAIKSKNGFTLVQDPAEAQYPGMVESAIASGCADEILPVAEIARRLTELAQEKAPAGRSSVIMRK